MAFETTPTLWTTYSYGREWAQNTWVKLNGDYYLSLQQIFTYDSPPNQSYKWLKISGTSAGTVTSVTGLDSILATPNPITGAGALKLVNDVASPTASQYYGTNSGATRGWFNLPSTGTGTVTNIATAGLISGGAITTTGTVTTSMNTNKLVGRGTAGVGIMEEITIGTNLSLSGTTLDATFTSPPITPDTQIDYGDGVLPYTSDANWVRSSYSIGLQDNPSNLNIFIGGIPVDGNAAGNNTTTGFNNTAVGVLSMQSNTTGNTNTAVGYLTLNANTTGGTNTAIGDNTMDANTTGFNNTAVGGGSLQNNITGNSLTLIGAFADVDADGHSNSIGIGNQAQVDKDNQFVVGSTDSVLNWKIRGIDYVMPSLLVAGSMLTDANGDGTLSWSPFGINPAASGGIVQVYSFSVTLTAAQIQTANSVPIDVGLPASGAGFYYRVTAFDGAILFGTIAFTSSNLVILRSAGGGNGQFILSGILAQTGNDSYQGAFNGGESAYQNNGGLIIQADSDSLVGDSTVVCYITVQLIRA